MPLTNLLQVEDAIVTALTPIADTGGVFREPTMAAEALVNSDLTAPVLVVKYDGFAPTGPGAGRPLSQRITQFWIVDVQCRKVDYMSKGGVVALAVVNALVGLTHADWPGPLRLYDERPDNRAQFDADVMTLPLTFAVDLVV